MIDMRGLQKRNIDNTQPEPTQLLPIAETGRWWALFPPLSSFYKKSVELFIQYVKRTWESFYFVFLFHTYSFLLFTVLLADPRPASLEK